MATPSIVGIGSNINESTKNAVEKTVDEYSSYFTGDADGSQRKAQYTSMVNDYYDLVTDFYEYGWGESFHFATRHTNESFAASVARHEHWLAYRMNIQPGEKVADIGCGVGGPLREIARFTGANVIGVNNNAYQIKRGRIKNATAGLDKLCDFIKADFMNIPVPDGEFDAAYAIEATCHAPDKVGCYSEIFRILKPGGVFAGYEWNTTDLYDAENPEHKAIIEGIEYGDGLPPLIPTQDVLSALKEAGFEILEEGDRALASDIPWYATLAGAWSISNFRYTRLGRLCTHYMVWCLEKIGLAPRGSTATHTVLQTAASNLVAGGQTGIFTPMYYFKARKPL